MVQDGSFEEQAGDESVVLQSRPGAPAVPGALNGEGDKALYFKLLIGAVVEKIGYRAVGGFDGVTDDGATKDLIIDAPCPLNLKVAVERDAVKGE